MVQDEGCRRGELDAHHHGGSHGENKGIKQDHICVREGGGYQGSIDMHTETLITMDY